jgi:hypothetical protein
MSLGGPKSRCMLSQQSMHTAKPHRDDCATCAKPKPNRLAILNCKAWPERPMTFWRSNANHISSHIENLTSRRIDVQPRRLNVVRIPNVHRSESQFKKHELQP